MSSDSTQLPRVGIGVLVVRQDKVLLGLRKGSHSAGLWAAPGGDLEWGEEMQACAQRELAEECGAQLQTKNWRFIMLANFARYQPHYTMIGFACEWSGGEVINGEPDKKERWEWFPIHQLPSNTLRGASAMVEAYLSGQFLNEDRSG